MVHHEVPRALLVTIGFGCRLATEAKTMHARSTCHAGYACGRLILSNPRLEKEFGFAPDVLGKLLMARGLANSLSGSNYMPFSLSNESAV